ncbi:hypothetical protein PG995_008634 [Apiospora arundinis]
MPKKNQKTSAEVSTQSVDPNANANAIVNANTNGKKAPRELLPPRPHLQPWLFAGTSIGATYHRFMDLGCSCLWKSSRL